MRRLVGVLAVAALVAAATASAVDRDHWINAISIGRAELGYPVSSYELLFGRAEKRSRSTLEFTRRGITIYLDPRTRRGVGVETRNRFDRTLDDVGPGSSERSFRTAYPDAPHRGNIYYLGRLLFFAACGRIKTVLLLGPTLHYFQGGAFCRR